MRDDVLIVLNEREPLKQQMATELAKLLADRSISTARLKPVKNMPEIIRERCPRVAVVDYLIGDYGTVLDVLSDLEGKELEQDLQIVVWTDEASANVAVSAMKLGAADYVEMGVPNSLERVLEAIEKALKESEHETTIIERGRRAPAFELPVAEDKHTVHTLSLAASFGKSSKPIVVILGEQGTGRNTLARYIHSNRVMPGSYSEFDFDTFAGDIATVCGGSGIRGVPLLSFVATVMIDHVESDTGELIEAVERRRASLWPDLHEAHPMLIVGTSSPETAATWARLVNAEVLELAPLSARHDDFTPLVQRFSIEAQGLTKPNRLKISSALLSEMEKLDWPGNIRELRSVIVEALTLPVDGAVDVAAEKAAEAKSAGKTGEGSLSRAERFVLRAMLSAKARWERYHISAFVVPQPIAARFAIDEALGNFRIAAARLGTGVPQLREALAKQVAPSGAATRGREKATASSLTVREERE